MIDGNHMCMKPIINMQTNTIGIVARGIAGTTSYIIPFLQTQIHHCHKSNDVIDLTMNPHFWGIHLLNPNKCLNILILSLHCIPIRQVNRNVQHYTLQELVSLIFKWARNDLMGYHQKFGTRNVKPLGNTS
jgi:hypothetical protein